MSKKRLSLISFIILLLIITSSCKEKEPEYPLGGPLPNSDIVFMPDADPLASTTNKSLGFINSDGTNRQEYTFDLIGGAPTMFGLNPPTQYASHPRWSPGGEQIVFTIPNTAPNIRVIDENGIMFGAGCADIRGGVVTFDINNNVLSRIREQDPIYEEYEETAESSIIARYDLKTCELESIIELPISFGTYVGEINETINGLITASFYDQEVDSLKILIYNPKTGDTRQLTGFHPSLTQDGSRLAYYDTNGALVVRDMKNNEGKILVPVFPSLAHSGPGPNLMSMPGWSPDNKWLVYNTPDGEIYKINIETKENIYLTYGWAPDWR